MSETLRTISVIAFSIAAVSLIASVILWFTLNIQNVIGFLTGRNVKRATENFGSAAGRKLYKRPSGNAAKPGKPAKKITVPAVEATAPLDGDETVAPTSMLESEPTTALAEGTALLDDSEQVEGTALLEEEEAVDGTTLLEEDRIKHSSFVITESIVMVHTDEHIKFSKK